MEDYIAFVSQIYRNHESICLAGCVLAPHHKNKHINFSKLKSEVALMDIIGEKLFKEISDVYKRAIY